MTEPNTALLGGVTLTAVAAALGPVLGPYAVITVAALLGAWVRLTERPRSVTWAGAKYLFRAVATAVVITGLLVWLISSQAGLPNGELLAPVSFVIGLRNERVLAWLGARIPADPPTQQGGEHDRR